MLHSVDGAAISLGRLSRFPITGGYQLVTQLCMLTRRILSVKSMAVYLDTDSLTSCCGLPLIDASSGFTDDFKCGSWVLFLVAAFAALWWTKL